MTSQTVESRPGGGGTGGLRGSGGAARPANLPRIALTALAPAVWGTTYIVTTELLPDGHPLFAGLLRALPAGLIALALTRTLPRGTWWWKAAALGVLNIGLFLPLLFTAAERLPGGVAATLGAAQPLVVAFLAVGILGERLSAWRLLWGAVGVAGVGLVVIGPDAALDGVGIAAGLAGAATMALGVTLTRRWGRPPGVSPTAFAGWQLTAGGLFLLPVTFLAEGAPPEIGAKAALGYLWLGLVGGLITYALWFQGITTLPVTSAALLGLLSPLVAAVLGASVLDQTLGLIQLLGFGLALAALVAGQLPPPGRAPVPPAPERSAPVAAGTVRSARVLAGTERPDSVPAAPDRPDLVAAGTVRPDPVLTVPKWPDPVSAGTERPDLVPAAPEPPALERPAAEPSVRKSLASKLPASKSPASEPSVRKSPAPEPPVPEPSAAESNAAESSVVKRSAAEPNTRKGTPR